MLFPYRTLRRAVSAVALLLAFQLPLFAQTAKPNCLVKVTVLQVNDVYQFAPVERGTSGGLGRLATLRKRIQADSPNLLFMLAGDTLAPSVESNMFKGKQMVEAWNAVGLDYSVYGNHEFDFGPDVLRDRMKESRFGWMGANVIDKKTGKIFGGAPPFVIREFGGVKIGIIGMTLVETTRTSKPGPDLEFRDPCTTARPIVAQLHRLGVRTIIALTHLAMAEDKALARCVPLDLIVGGHEHTLLQSSSAGTPIFKMTSDAREMGRIQLNINPNTGKVESIDWSVIPVNSTTATEDPEFTAAMSKYDSLMKELAVPIGHTDVPLNARSKANRTQETNVADFVADAYRRVTNADVALINGGSIRADLTYDPGELTKRDVASISPYPDPVLVLKITGATLRAALEQGVSRSAEDAEPGRFPQVSGMRYKFDASHPSGSRLVEVTVGGAPLDDKKEYTVATTGFVAGGGDGYTTLQGATVLNQATAPKAPDVLREAITSQPSIAPQLDGRIVRVDQASDAKKDTCVAPAAAPTRKQTRARRRW
jgi:5'-nucleotidase